MKQNPPKYTETSCDKQLAKASLGSEKNARINHDDASPKTQSEDIQMDQVLKILAGNNGVKERVMHKLRQLETAPESQIKLISSDQSHTPNYVKKTPLSAIFQSNNQSSNPRKSTWLSLAAVIILLCIFAPVVLNTLNQTKNTELIIGLSNVQGDVNFSNADNKLRIDKSGPIKLQPYTLITTGPQGAITLNFDDPNGPTSLTVFPNTSVQLIAYEPAKQWKLKSGLIEAKVSPQDEPFQVHSAQSTATVLGTEFEYSAGFKESKLHVSEGQVSLTSNSGESITVSAGQTVKAAGTGLDVRLSFINNKPLKAPQINAIYLTDTERSSPLNQERQKFEDGSILEVNSNAANQALELLLDLADDTPGKLNIKLLDQAGHSFYQNSIVVNDTSLELHSPLTRREKSIQIETTLPAPNQMPNGYITLVLSSEVANSTNTPESTIERHINFRIQQTD